MLPQQQKASIIVYWRYILDILQLLPQSDTQSSQYGIRGDVWLLKECGRVIHSFDRLSRGARSQHASCQKDSPRFCQVVDQYSKNKNINCPSVCACAWGQKDCVSVYFCLVRFLQPDDSSHYLGQCNSVLIVCHFSIMEINLREKSVAWFASVVKERKYFIHSVH